MSLTGKRIVAGVYVAVLLLTAGNRYLEWGLMPGFEKQILAVVMFIGVLCIARFGSSMLHEIEEYRDKQKPNAKNEH